MVLNLYVQLVSAHGFSVKINALAAIQVSLTARDALHRAFVRFVSMGTTYLLITASVSLVVILLVTARVV